MAATPIISLDYLKTFLNVRLGNTSLDTRLTPLIAVASSMIEAETRRSFGRATRTEFFNSRLTQTVSLDLFSTHSEDAYRLGAREQMVTLSALPIVPESLTVFYDTKRVWGPETQVQPEDYHLGTYTGRLTLRIPTQEATESIKAVYQGGYEINADGNLQDSAPEELKLACALQAIFLFNKTNTSNVGTDSDNTDGQARSSFNTKGGLIPEVRGMIGHYRRVLTGVG